MSKAIRLGLVKTSLIDFPGMLSAVLFTGGCNLRCPYCHNPELVEGDPEDFLPWEEIRAFLTRRRGILKGVVFTGGEPLLKGFLPSLIEEVRGMGYACKLDTNGTLPQRLEEVLPLLDYVAVDFKTAPDLYHRVGGDTTGGEKVKESLGLVAQQGIPHEVRVTACPPIVDREVFSRMLEDLPEGIDHVVVAGFRPSVTLDPAYRGVAPYPPKELEEWKHLCEERGIRCSLRFHTPHEDDPL
ncbi:anaerobic ribonucleoside-triphosphate reductase activating protein [Spirochaeta thermophila]|uniref:Radical SAM core domain-containing protein n=1 Tax=Winmispira thermophila (strain ATCC 49972 / DSM 6192 / RI 19.B1) TaxID=665571 RepID=E0RR60_WINT6|nr:anaerobic ribonucleoside-triphosphate reductase activating protein [Spirochaeta thermophila]ADN01638.1 hypothetical protein STHERM_c06800 [Spirochaeta thermophila DSM 6192]